MEITISKQDQEQIVKEGHIDALIQIKNKPTSHPDQEAWNDERERYHMAALHRRWFSSSRKEKQA
jgi:hypothetical protein